MIIKIKEDAKSIITPDEAQELINRYEASDFVNRTPYEASVKNYEKELKEGKWYLNGETIKLNKDGVPIDGLHRLTSIVRAGIPMECFVIQLDGDTNKIVPTIDVGRKKSIENVLKMQGEMYERGVMSILRYHKVLQKGGLSIGQSDANNGFTYQTLIEAYKKMRDEYCEAAIFARNVCKKTNMKVADVGGIYMHLVYDLGWESDIVEEFFNRIRNVAPSVDTGIFATTYELLKDKSVRNVQRTEIYMKCWNNWRKGNPKNLRVCSDHFWKPEECKARIKKVVRETVMV